LPVVRDQVLEQEELDVAVEVSEEREEPLVSFQGWQRDWKAATGSPGAAVSLLE